jgi:hypothetical protein
MLGRKTATQESSESSLKVLNATKVHRYSAGGLPKGCQKGHNEEQKKSEVYAFQDFSRNSNQLSSRSISPCKVVSGFKAKPVIANMAQAMKYSSVNKPGA